MPRTDGDVKGRKAVNNGHELLRTIQKYENVYGMGNICKDAKDVKDVKDC